MGGVASHSIHPLDPPRRRSSETIYDKCSEKAGHEIAAVTTFAPKQSRNFAYFEYS